MHGHYIVSSRPVVLVKSQHAQQACSTVPLHYSLRKLLRATKMHEALKLGAAVRYTARAPATTKVQFFNDGDSRRRTQSRLHLARLWDGIGKPKLHTERPFLNMLVAASILTARNIYIDAWTLHCFIKASGSCKVAACTASLQHSATALFFAKVASSNKNARGFEARCCCQVYRSGACDHQSAITHPFPGH